MTDFNNILLHSNPRKEFICEQSLLTGSTQFRGNQPLFEELAGDLFTLFERNFFSCGSFIDVAQEFDFVSHDILCDFCVTGLHKLGILS